MMKLYFMPESPPCAAVLMVLDELRLPFEPIHVDLSKGEQLRADFLKVRFTCPGFAFRMLNERLFDRLSKR